MAEGVATGFDNLLNISRCCYHKMRAECREGQYARKYGAFNALTSKSWYVRYADKAQEANSITVLEIAANVYCTRTNYEAELSIE